MNKLTNSKDAIAGLSSGMTLGIGGWGPRRKPMALVREILRSAIKDLTIVAYGGADVGMLCASGKVKKLIFAFVSLDFIPLEPYFRQARQNAAIEVMEIDEGMMVLGLQAAAYGIPFIPTAVGLGTDVVTRNPELKMIESPYKDKSGGNKDWLAMPALTLDACLIHVDRADNRGVCQIKGPDHYMDDWFARAAANTIVSCDELVDSSYFHQGDESRYVFWERSQTQSIVHIPFGAHPASCNPLYGIDVKHFKQYNTLAKQDNGWQHYRDEYVVLEHSSYIEKVGGEQAIKSLALPIY